MKQLFIMLLIVPSLVFAQKVDLKEIDAGDDDTTIQISKGKKNTVDAKCEAIWEVVDGTADINGEPAIMSKEANQSWRKACEDWKKEFRNDNKENKILASSCGTVSCTSDAGGKVCSSKATYKLKTKLN